VGGPLGTGYGLREIYSRSDHRALPPAGLKPSDFAKVIYPCYYGAARRNINKKLGLEPAQVEDDLLQESGDTGTAHPLLMLSKALEEASPGDKLLLVSYGSGCDALYFEVTPDIARFNDRKRFSDTLTRRAELDNYTKYLTWRDMVPVDLGLRGEEEQVTRWSMIWRSRKAIHGLQGSCCNKCGTQQYPPQRICVNPDCGAIDEMAPLNLSDKGGKIVSYTSDTLAATINPPAIYGHVDFNGGGRTMFEFTDCTLEDLQLDGQWSLLSGSSTTIRSGIRLSTSGKPFQQQRRCLK